MSTDDERKLQPPAIRELAEEELARHPVTEAVPRAAADLLHELRVHQIELEM